MAILSRAETVKGTFRRCAKLAAGRRRVVSRTVKQTGLLNIETRYRYSGCEKSARYRSGGHSLLLMMIPSMLSALSVVRESWSMINLYVTPTTQRRFLLGKATAVYRWVC